MYKNEEFQPVDTINKGELVMKFPGTNIKIPYESGITFMNKAGTVGCVALNITDLIAESVCEPKGLMGEQGSKIAKLLQEPSSKEQIKQRIKTLPLSIFYSKTLDDLEVFTIPIISDRVQINNQNFPKMVIRTYNVLIAIPSVEQVYDTIHAQVISYRKLSKDKANLEVDLKTLTKKTNIIYDLAFKLMRQRGY